MDSLAHELWTLEDYRANEEVSEVRHEFYAGQIFAMAGGSPRHAFIKEAISLSFGRALKGSGCRGASADLRVRIEATGFHTYPDYLVVCGKGEYAADDPHSLLNPVVIVEVLSPTTEKHDRTFKMDHYRRIPALRQYILVAQDRMRVEVCTPTDQGWAREILIDPAASLALTAVNASVTVAEIYDGIDFDGPA